MNPDTRRFLTSQMMWLGASLAISFALSLILPFPISLIAMIGVFIGMSYFIRRRQMRRMGMSGGFGNMFGGSGGGGVNYVCISCGQKFKGGDCPRCGSRMKKADF
jgi:hypothetical protein